MQSLVSLDTLSSSQSESVVYSSDPFRRLRYSVARAGNDDEESGLWQSSISEAVNTKYYIL